MNPTEVAIIEREKKLREWFTRGCDPIRKIVDGLDIGWSGVQRWATARMTLSANGLLLDIACGYATFLAQLGWRFPTTRLVGLNIDFDGPHALAWQLLSEAGVTAALVQADARQIPFADGGFTSASCFLGLQDIEIGFGVAGVQAVLAETVRVLCVGGTLTLLDEFAFDKFDALLDGLPLVITDRAERALDARWSREVAEQAIALYADGWGKQIRDAALMSPQQTRTEVYHRMFAEMERQLDTQGYYVPFGAVRLIVARKFKQETG